jgi:hypothetical protein
MDSYFSCNITEIASVCVSRMCMSVMYVLLLTLVLTEGIMTLAVLFIRSGCCLGSSCMFALNRISRSALKLASLSRVGQPEICRSHQIAAARVRRSKNSSAGSFLQRARQTSGNDRSLGQETNFPRDMSPEQVLAAVEILAHFLDGFLG